MACWPHAAQRSERALAMEQPVSATRRPEGERTASQRNSDWGAALRCTALRSHTKLGLRAAAPSLPLGRGRPLASKLAVCLTSAPIGSCGWPMVPHLLGPTEPMVGHCGGSLARWRSGARIDFTAPVSDQLSSECPVTELIRLGNAYGPGSSDGKTCAGSCTGSFKLCMNWIARSKQSTDLAI